MKAVPPFPQEFPGLLEEYCGQIDGAIRAKKHHGTRRHLFLNFLRVAFSIKPTDVELESKVTAGELRGRIDALYRHIIVEVKTDFDAERDDAQRELRKYFASRPKPTSYIGLVTDGRRLEAWHLNHRGGLASISATELRPDDPLHAWRWLDQFLSAGVRLVPTSDELIERFGGQSAVFRHVSDRLLALYNRVKEEPLVAVKFREWNALLAKVYGSPLGKAPLFINHTYLMLVSRIIVTLALKGAAPKRSELRGLVDGGYFTKQLNLKNLAEPDFFSWALETDAEADFLALFDELFQRFTIFRFADLAEDVLKNLYQELVDPETRHDLGEYYTPDWLAQLTLERLGYRGGSILDPACGSGGFLFAAVQALRSAGMKGDRLVAHALDNVIGIDVHPVAVLMSKANLVLALRHELSHFSGEAALRVYMADTLMAEEDTRKGVLTINVTGKQAFHIPLATVGRGGLDELIDFLSDFAHCGSKDEAAAEKAARAVGKRLEAFGKEEACFWHHNFRLLLKLGKGRRNTLWAYVLKNACRPEFLRRAKVDFIAGNPPWLAYRYIKDNAYKARVKALTFGHGLLARGQVKLFTQMDTSTLFVAHCEREFLRPGGALGMVLPKAVILPAKQHLAFQRKGFTEVHDLTGVEPLFTVRTCMIVRRAPYAPAGVPRISWSGRLRARNLSLAAALPSLTHVDDTASFDAAAGERSPYYDRFFQGATLVPRCLCFVEPAAGAVPNLGAPFVRTSQAAYDNSKKEWRLQVDGKVEREYLFGSLLAKDLMPFVVRRLLLAALPVISNSRGDLAMVGANDALSQGHRHAHDWFAQAQEKWEKRCKDKEMSFAERLNYTKGLTGQTLAAPFVVLYNASGTNISAAFLSRDDVRELHGIPIRGFLAESATYRYYADSREEAHFLVGVLNTSFVNEAIKPFQPQGLMGERHVHRRPFEACNIPLFDPADALHCEIAQVSAAAREELLPVVPKMELAVGPARAAARNLVAGKLSHLDELACRLLRGGKLKAPRGLKSRSQGEFRVAE